MQTRLGLLSFVFLFGCGTPGTPTTPGTPPEEPVAPAMTDSADRGAEVFSTHCAVCHGPEGAGDGPGAAALDPPPPDLLGPRADHLRGIPRRTIIEEGRPGTAMVGWKAILPPEDLDAVYGFVHAMKHGPDGKRRGGPHRGMGAGRQGAGAAAPAGVDAAATARAKDAMKALGGSLKSKLVSTMKEQGPVAALEVCSSNAQSLTAEMAAARGVLLGRSSGKLRNPANAGPDWVQAWLAEQGERSAEGVPGLTQQATLADGTPVVRVLKPLAVEAPCLVCHGPAAGRSPELSAALAERYPSDQATEYAAGDLRGAIWAETRVGE